MGAEARDERGVLLGHEPPVRRDHHRAIRYGRHGRAQPRELGRADEPDAPRVEHAVDVEEDESE